MRICKSVAVLGTAVLLLAYGGFAEGVDSVTGVHPVTSPKMPTINSPTIGTGFYTPGTRQSAVTQTTGGNAGSSASVASSGTTSGGTASNASDGSVATTVQQRLSTLSASDLQSLSSKGLFSQIGSLFDPSSLTQQLGTGGLETNTLLQHILNALEDIKTQQTAVLASGAVAQEGAEQALPVQAVADAETVETPAVSRTAAKPRLLRFMVNGYSILRTCRTVYISDIQKDGSFLVTGDRRYVSDGKTRSETFHLLFKTDPNSSSNTNYAVASVLTQDYLNTNSFMYQLSQRQNLSAARTGNLVTMRTTDPEWKLELLIDLGESE